MTLADISCRLQATQSRAFHVAAVACLVGAIVIIAASFTDLTRYGTWADQASYLSAALSLAYDHDLRWEAKDLHRFEDQGFSEGPRGIILVPSGTTGHWYHSIAWTYPLAASPFVRLMGHRGMLVFNGVLFTLLWTMVLDVLWRRLGLCWGGVLAVICTVFSLPFVYVFVMMAELWNAVLLMGCFYLIDIQDSRCARDPHHRSARFSRRYTCALLIGVAAAMAAVDKPLYGVLELLLFFLVAWRWGYRTLLAAVGGFLVAVCTYSSINHGMTGELDIRGDARRCFEAEYPLAPHETREIRRAETTGDSVAVASGRAQTTYGSAVSGQAGLFGSYQRVTSVLRMPNPRLLCANLRFFVVGKYTGILWHQPGLVACFLLVLARRPTFRRLALAGALVITAYAWITLLHHYWSGAHAFGNRYFMPEFCTAVFIVPHKPRPAFAYPAIIAASCLAVLGYGPVVRDPVRNSLYTELHVLRSPFRWGPLEETLLPQVAPISLGHGVIVPGGSAFVFGREPYAASDRDVILADPGHTTDILLMTDGVPHTLALCVQAHDVPIKYSINLDEDSRQGRLDTGRTQDVAFFIPQPSHGEPLTDCDDLLLKVRLWLAEDAPGAQSEPCHLWIGRRCEDCFPSFTRRRFQMDDSDPVGFYVQGWGHEEQWGERTVRWTLGQETVACFRLKYFVSKIIVLGMAKTVWQNQYVDIGVNGTTVDRWGPIAVSPFTLYSTTIPGELLRWPPAVNDLTFRCSVAGRPAAAGTGTEDTRELAVAFDWLEILSME